ncbi:MAG: presenilin family intramembrane aspartyl protease [archaeon]
MARKAKKKKATTANKKISKTEKLQKVATKESKTPNKENENWLSPRAITLLVIIFIITQGAGLFVAHLLFLEGAQVAPITDNINDIENAIYLFVVIMVMTAIILIALKLRRTTKFLWFIEALAIFSTCIITFSALLPAGDLIVLLITALVLYMRYWKRENILIRDIAGIIAIIGSGAYIGISLGIFPVLAFIIALAIYDLIAVFYTKHMVEMGKAVTKSNFAFTIAMPTKKHRFELGNGDLVIPLIVAASILTNGPFINNSLIAGLCAIVSFIGLLFSIYSVGKWKRPMPALPPQTLLMVIVIIAGLLLGA